MSKLTSDDARRVYRNKWGPWTEWLRQQEGWADEYRPEGSRCLWLVFQMDEVERDLPEEDDESEDTDEPESPEEEW